MKKRKEKEVKTSTLVILLVLFGILFSAILIPFFCMGIENIKLMIFLAILVFALAIFLAFVATAIIAIILKWRI